MKSLPAEKCGSEGSRIKAIKEIVDPETGKTRLNVANVRSSGPDHLHAHGVITDRQKAAADRFEELYRFAHEDGLAAIDYSRVRVDCASRSDMSGSGRKTRAIKELALIEKAIGPLTLRLLVRVICEGKTMTEAAKLIVDASGRGQRQCHSYVTVRVQKALDELDAHWNTAVGAGSGIRADAGERTEVRVELKPEDTYAHMTREQKIEHARVLMAELAKMKANDDRAPSGRKKAG